MRALASAHACHYARWCARPGLRPRVHAHPRPGFYGSRQQCSEGARRRVACTLRGFFQACKNATAGCRASAAEGAEQLGRGVWSHGPSATYSSVGRYTPECVCA
eukprot:3151879-Pleurochrysis_carterae.AAC.1